MRKVVVQRLAKIDIQEAWHRAAVRAPRTADAWLDRLQETISTLQQNPDRCPLAAENGRVEVELRELLFGRRPNVFRIVFTIDADTVRVLRFLRASRRHMSRQQVIDALEESS